MIKNGSEKTSEAARTFFYPFFFRGSYNGRVGITDIKKKQQNVQFTFNLLFPGLSSTKQDLSELDLWLRFGGDRPQHSNLNLKK